MYTRLTTRYGVHQTKAYAAHLTKAYAIHLTKAHTGRRLAVKPGPSWLEP